MGSVGCTGELICDKGHIYPLKDGKKSKGVRVECSEEGGAEVGQWKAIDKNGQSSKLQSCIEGTYSVARNIFIFISEHLYFLHQIRMTQNAT